MIGRTNIPLGLSGAVDGVTVADLPTRLSSLTATANSKAVILKLSYSDTDFVSGVDVLYKTGSYPTSPTDGNCVTVEGAATSVTVSSLTNAVKYYFRVYLWRLIDGVKYYQTDETNAKVYATPSAVGISGITPAKVTSSYMIIDKSGSFTLTIPENLTLTAYLVGGGENGDVGWESDDSSGGYPGGNGGSGGGYKQQTLSTTGTVSCVSTIGQAVSSNGSATVTTFKFGSVSYSTSGFGRRGGNSSYEDGLDGLSTPYGYIGSGGGVGGFGGGGYGPGSGGVGAGDGGDGAYDDYDNDGIAGGNATNYGCGGGGGGGAYDSGSGGAGGKGKQGCIIIAWS